MAPSLSSELFLLLVLSGMFFLPGSGLLVISGTWRRWDGLQRYVVAVGLSLAFFPILFYATRFFLPAAQIRPFLLWPLLVLFLTITIWGTWQHGAFTLRLEPLEWIAIAILLLTLASRFWFANNYPFPAWSDSLHHTLLTDLTAENGRLPYSLEPYFPNQLDMYHLGLYALTGTAQMLAQVPAHSALLWTAQFLNGLCGLGIYLLLDKHVGRRGAVVATAVAGLFSIHPALWSNWGRFTQLASLIILPFSWALVLDTFQAPFTPTDMRQTQNRYVWLLLFTTATIVAVFLYHFRVAIFYALLLGITLLQFIWKSKQHQWQKLIKPLIWIAGFSLLFIFPILWDATALYFEKRTVAIVPVTTATQQQLNQNYYEFPLETVPYLVAPVWLLILAGLTGLFGLVRCHHLVISTIVWTISLVGLGNIYLLNIPALNVTNLGAVLIMMYLPISVVIGTAVETAVQQLPDTLQIKTTYLLMAALLLVSFPAAWNRGNMVESYRHFVTEDDITAMTWINDNIPEDATFAINTYFWLPAFAHGTDAGYWIPYFTGRHIITSSMLSDGLTPEYQQLVLAQSQVSESLELSLSAVNSLYAMGIHYIYVGTRGDFSGPGLPLAQLAEFDRVELMYQHGGAAIFRIKSPPP